MSGRSERSATSATEVEQTELIDASGNTPPRPRHEQWEGEADHVVDSWTYRHPWHAEQEELGVGTAWYGGRFRYSKAI